MKYTAQKNLVDKKKYIIKTMCITACIVCFSQAMSTDSKSTDSDASDASSATVSSIADLKSSDPIPAKETAKVITAQEAAKIAAEKEKASLYPIGTFANFTQEELADEIKYYMQNTLILSKKGIDLYKAISHLVNINNKEKEAVNTKIYNASRSSNNFFADAVKFYQAVFKFGHLVHNEEQKETEEMKAVVFKQKKLDMVKFLNDIIFYFKKTIDIYQKILHFAELNCNGNAESKKEIEKILFIYNKSFTIFWQENPKLFEFLSKEQKKFIIKCIIFSENPDQLQYWRQNQFEWYKAWQQKLIDNMNPVCAVAHDEKLIPGEPCFSKLPFWYREKLEKIKMYPTFENAEEICNKLKDYKYQNYTLGVLFLYELKKDPNCELAIKILAQVGHLFTNEYSNDYGHAYNAIYMIIGETVSRKIAKLADLAIFYQFIEGRHKRIKHEITSRMDKNNDIVFSNFDKILLSSYNLSKTHTNGINAFGISYSTPNEYDKKKEIFENIYKYYMRYSQSLLSFTTGEKYHTGLNYHAYDYLYEQNSLMYQIDIDNIGEALFQLPIGNGKTLNDVIPNEMKNAIQYDNGDDNYQTIYDIFKYEIGASFILPMINKCICIKRINVLQTNPNDYFQSTRFDFVTDMAKYDYIGIANPTSKDLLELSKKRGSQKIIEEIQKRVELENEDLKKAGLKIEGIGNMLIKI